MSENPARLAEEYSVALGDDYDCDTCGYTWNSLRFDPDWDDDGSNVWVLTLSVGCYGGESVTSTEPDALTRIDDVLAACHQYPGWADQDEKTIRDHIATLN